MKPVIRSTLNRRDGEVIVWQARLATLGVLLLMSCPAAVVSQLTVERTIFVSATGTGEENCTAVRNLLDGLLSGTRRYLIKLGPGTYDCGTTSLAIPGNVTLEGAGRRATYITGVIDNDEFGVVDFAEDGGTLRSLAVGNDGISTADAVAVTVFNARSVSLENVDLAVGAVVHPGLIASLRLLSFGEGNSSRVEVRNSHLSDGIKTEENCTINFHSSQLDEFRLDTTDGGTVRCGSSYDSGFNPLDKTCSTIP